MRPTKCKDYEFIGGVSDIQTLTDLGFIDNCLRTHEPIKVDEGEFEAIKTLKTVKIAITVWHLRPPYKGGVMVYRFEGKPDDHKCIANVDDPKRYLKGLIDAGLVRKKVR